MSLKRKKIGLLFAFDETWAGGYYYLKNIISALNFLPDEEKPELVIFYLDNNLRKKVDHSDYPYLTFLPFAKRLSLPARVRTKITRLLFDKKYYPQYPQDTVDFIYPCTSIWHLNGGSIRNLKKIFWIPDFQHKFLPHFFSQKEIAERDKTFQAISNVPVRLVFSSETAHADFLKLYPGSVADLMVMNFATVLPDFQSLAPEALLEKFGLAKPYFISPNQFWAHKNHMVVLKAVALLKKRGLNPIVAFTGKEEDYRNPEYFKTLKAFVEESQIQDNIRFLGFIDRKEQLQLMNHSAAVIQPSLFEGWSTVIEDAKAMDQLVIASDLKVHREQCGDKAIYFDPANDEELATVMQRTLDGAFKPVPYHYHQKVLKFSKQLVDLDKRNVKEKTEK